MPFALGYFEHLWDSWMDWTLTLCLDGHIGVLGRSLHIHSRLFQVTIILWWVTGENLFLGGFVVGGSTFVFIIFKSL